MNALIVLLLFVWFGVGIANIVASIRLKKYRLDIGPMDSALSGDHWSWQGNVLRPKNYDAEGRAKLRWLYGSMMVQLAALIAAMAVAIG